MWFPSHDPNQQRLTVHRFLGFLSLDICKFYSQNSIQIRKAFPDLAAATAAATASPEIAAAKAAAVAAATAAEAAVQIGLVQKCHILSWRRRTNFLAESKHGKSNLRFV